MTTCRYCAQEEGAGMKHSWFYDSPLFFWGDILATAENAKSDEYVILNSCSYLVHWNPRILRFRFKAPMAAASTFGSWAFGVGGYWYHFE